MDSVANVNVMVNAITNQFGDQIKEGFRGLDRVAGASARDMAKSFNREIAKLNADRPLGRVAERLRELAPNADSAYNSFVRLVRISYGLQAGLGAITGSIGAVLSGIVAIGASAAGAIPSIVSLGAALSAALVGARVGSAAFKGIGGALQALKAGGGGGGGGGATTVDNTEAIDAALRALAMTIERNQRRIVDANNEIRASQLRLNRAYAEAREEIQQIGFETEDAALAQSRAALELEKAREELARVQDLPPNSRVRRSAELAFQQADLDYRQAKDRATDLATEQDRLAQTGVEGTRTVIAAKEELAEAEENLRDVVLDSVRDQEEAQRRLEDAQKPVTRGGGGGGGAAADPLAGLTESQKTFVRFLQSEVIPTLFSLREAAADGFLPVLETQIRRFYQAGAFELLRLGIASVSTALGESVTAFMDVFLLESNLKNFSQFFTDSAKIIPTFGKILGNSLRIVLTLFAAAAPVTERFVEAIDRATEQYAAFLEQGQATGELTASLQESADLMARWGGVFSDIFGAIGDIVEANVGPGSGGDLLLQWLERAFNNLNNLDSTFLDIYFANVGQNFIEILDGFNIIVDAMLEAGGNPAVGEFWRILSAGGGLLQEVVRDSVNAGPLLASVLRSLFQIVALFADEGPLTFFLTTLKFMAAGASALVTALQPLLLIIGPIFAVASSLGLAFTILNKGFAVMVGFLRNLMAPFITLTGHLLGQTAAAKALSVAEKELLLTKLAMSVANKKAAVETAAATVLSLANVGTIQAQTAAKAKLTVVTQVYEVAIRKAGVAAVTTGAITAAAFLPVTIALAALAAVAAVVFTVLAINQQNMDKAVESTTTAMKNNKSVVEQWGAATLSMANGPMKDTTKEINNLGEGLRNIKEASKPFANASYEVSQSSRGTKRALEAFGTSLSNLAGTDLPQAQKSFRGLVESQDLSTAEMRTALAEMPDYREALLAQADAMGINLRNSDGVVDSTKQLEFAMGIGEVAIRNHTAALEAESLALVDAALKSAHLFEVAKVGTEEGEVTFDEFLTQMREKASFTVKEVAATQELAQSGLTSAAIAMLQESGLTAQEILAETTARGAEMVTQSNRDALQINGTYNTAIASIAANGMSSIETAAKYAYDTGVITFDEFIAVTGAKIDGYTPEVVISADSKEFNDLETKLKKFIPTNFTVPLKISPSGSGKFSFQMLAVKNGGIIPGFADGGFFGGVGSVAGAGGPRDDRVPAMLSAGEYVVNAMATKRFKPLLEAINGGSPTFANQTSGGMSSQGGANVTIVVNPSAGMNEKELANMVSRTLASELRKGSAR